MKPGFSTLNVAHGDAVDPADIPLALGDTQFVFDDGATQDFRSDGTTTYFEGGRPSDGKWYVEGTSFCSFWPPSYTGCYDLTWLVEDGEIVGLNFVEQNRRASSFVGRYS